jgi:hypothetical protein
MRVLSHGIPDRVHLLPAFSPFVCITLLGAHIHNLQLIAPLLCVLFLVLDAVSLDGPFPRALPFHHSSALVRGKDDNVFATAAKHG